MERIDGGKGGITLSLAEVKQLVTNTYPGAIAREHKDTWRINTVIEKPKSVQVKIIGRGATELEAWADASLKILNAGK